MERQLVDLINDLRSNPSGWIDRLNNRAETYSGQEYKDSKGQTFISKEGRYACEEAVDILKEMTRPRSSGRLENEDCLEMVASEYCRDYIESSGDEVLIDQEGLDITQKLDSLGSWRGMIGHCVAFQAGTAEDILIKLLIDDGVASRRNRTALLHPSFQYIGVVSSSSHPKYENITVVILAEDFGVIGTPNAPEPKQNPNLIDEIPEDLKKAYPDCRTMKITKRTYTFENGYKKCLYEAKYKMKDGTDKTKFREKILNDKVKEPTLISRAPPAKPKESKPVLIPAKAAPAPAPVPAPVAAPAPKASSPTKSRDYKDEDEEF